MEKFASIPTIYSGVQFRSRLEARWATLFDLLEWEWEYEPFDLPGWIPDFVIKGNTDLLVEIKYFPVYTSFPEIDERWLKQLRKIEKANPDYAVLLLSNSPIDNESNLVEGCFGMSFEKDQDEMWKDREDEYNLLEHSLIWGSTCFIEEMYPIPYKPKYCVKGSTETSLENISKSRIIDYWKEAGNIVQWKKPSV